MVQKAQAQAPSGLARPRAPNQQVSPALPAKRACPLQWAHFKYVRNVDRPNEWILDRGSSDLYGKSRISSKRYFLDGNLLEDRTSLGTVRWYAMPVISLKPDEVIPPVKITILDWEEDPL